MGITIKLNLSLLARFSFRDRPFTFYYRHDPKFNLLTVRLSTITVTSDPSPKNNLFTTSVTGIVEQYFYRIYHISVTVPYRNILYVTVPYILRYILRYFLPRYKDRNTKRYFFGNGKNGRYTKRCRYYPYRKLKNKALQKK